MHRKIGWRRTGRERNVYKWQFVIGSQMRMVRRFKRSDLPIGQADGESVKKSV